VEIVHSSRYDAPSRQSILFHHPEDHHDHDLHKQPDACVVTEDGIILPINNNKSNPNILSATSLYSFLKESGTCVLCGRKKQDEQTVNCGYQQCLDPMQRAEARAIFISNMRHQPLQRHRYP
jgi:hypothetical protein